MGTLPLHADSSKSGPPNNGGGETAPLLVRGDVISSHGDSTRRIGISIGLFAVAAVSVTLMLATFLVVGGGSTAENFSSLGNREAHSSRRHYHYHHHFGVGLLGKKSSKKSNEGHPTASPFVSMEGMFEYEKWDKISFEEDIIGGSSLHQMLENYGASVPWDTIRSTITTGLGAKGRRKLFLLVRHAEAMHNEWGRLQKHVHKPETIPCDFKNPGDLVDPDLTARGERHVKRYIHDVFESGLAQNIGQKARIFSSPLSRCMRTSKIAFSNVTGLKIADGLITVSELLRERIDARVPFETRRPVTFVRGDGDGDGGDGGEDGAKNVTVGANATDDASQCFLPSKGLYKGHPGQCCVREGMTQKFGEIFDINVTTNKDAVTCALIDVAKVGWEKCVGPDMLGMLAEDDMDLAMDEESESDVVHRLRAWFANVFDGVDENVVIAVTHSDWINHATSDLGIHKRWFVPRNAEILPVIVEDTRPKLSNMKSEMEIKNETPAEK